MPVYNVEKFVLKAIKSILNQTVKNWELIIIDDCSTDSTLKIIEQESKKDSRINIIRNKTNSGITYGLNKGIKLAKGEYIARMDGDDLCEPRRFEQELAFLEGHKNHILIGTFGKIIDGEDKKVGIIDFPRNNIFLRLKMLEYNCFIHGSIMVRTKILKKIGGYSDKYKYAEDYFLWLRIMKFGKVGNIPLRLYSWRRNDTPSQRNVDIQNESTSRLLADIMKSSDYKAEKFVLRILFIYRKIKQWFRKFFK